MKKIFNITFLCFILLLLSNTVVMADELYFADFIGMDEAEVEEIIRKETNYDAILMDSAYMFVLNGNDCIAQLSNDHYFQTGGDDFLSTIVNNVSLYNSYNNHDYGITMQLTKDLNSRMTINEVKKVASKAGYNVEFFTDTDKYLIRHLGTDVKNYRLVLTNKDYVISYYWYSAINYMQPIMEQIKKENYDPYNTYPDEVEIRKNYETFEVEETTEPTCMLEELTDIDYLAFSNLAYDQEANSGDIGDTIKKMSSDKWDNVWSNNITYSDLYNHIQGWRFLTYKANINTGFFAMAFINDYNEIFITYRGSQGFGNRKENPDAWEKDWYYNNYKMFTNKDGSQVRDALNFYKSVIKDYNPSLIAIAGHSLGGALAEIVSAYSGCKGVTFNSPSFIDVAYAYYSAEMSGFFSGTDNWKFKDYINKSDFVGTWGREIKPRIELKDKGLADEHSLESFVVKNSEGNLEFMSNGEFIDVGCINYSMIYKRLVKGISIDLGTSKNDTIWGLSSVKQMLENLLVYPRRSYGGDGDDYINVINNDADILVGGKGTDYLNAGTGDDTYIYYKGDGLDYISDESGKDCLYLLGFDKEDKIRVESTNDPEYIDVYCNNDVIVKINKNVRGFFSKGNFKIRVNKGGTITEEYIDSSIFKAKTYQRQIMVSCPVDIEIIDEQGAVVYTIKDAETGAYYTDYGNFYVYEEENGEYGKVLSLVEGYSIKIVGVDKGEMAVAVRNIENDELSINAYVATSIPVKKNTTATIESSDNEMSIALDKDGDGNIDKEIPLELFIVISFIDVNESDYFYDAVQWAVDNGVTNGTSDTTFSPQEPCTRAQTVTFLWRAAGSPEPKKLNNPFIDVDENSYYYKAVLWAVEKGITNGTSEKTFSPELTISRAQTVTFLWRYAGSKSTKNTNTFIDVTDNAYYYNAVLWALKNKITQGTTATTFSPDDSCTRGQIVTFLYRYKN